MGRHEDELEPLLRAHGRRNADLLHELARLSAELADRGVEVELPRLEYEGAVAGIREEVERTVPVGATALIVSRGDPQLLRIGAREARHFPSEEDGRYLGRHPVDGEEAIELLEAQRSGGAGYLVIPAAEAWWLSHYRGFGEHLEAHAAATQHESCAIYSLAPALARVEEGRR